MVVQQSLHPTSGGDRSAMYGRNENFTALDGRTGGPVRRILRGETNDDNFTGEKT